MRCWGMMKRSGRLGGGGVAATGRMARGEGWPGRIWKGSALEAGAAGAGENWLCTTGAVDELAGGGLLCAVEAAGIKGRAAGGLLMPVTGAGAGRTVVVGGVLAVAGVLVVGV